MKHIAWPGALALVLAFPFTPALADGAAKPAAPQGAYQQERARCLGGGSGQDQATCLREAGAAAGEARSGGLGSASPADLARNATQRCEAQPPADRAACVERILGAGSAEGSVGGGGVLRRSESKAD